MSDEKLDYDEFQRLVVAGETDTVEFKKEVNIGSDDGRIKILSRILGMANTKSGYIIIGIEKKNDDYEIVGTDIDTDLLSNTVDNWVRDYIDPTGHLGYKIYNIPCNINDENSKCIIIDIKNVPGVCFGLRMKPRQLGEKTAYKLYIRQASKTECWDPWIFFRVAHVNFVAGIARLAEKEKEDMLGYDFSVVGVEDKYEEDKKGLQRYLGLWDESKEYGSKMKLLQNIRNRMNVIVHGEVDDEIIKIVNGLFTVIDECLKESGEKRISGLSILSCMDSIRQGKIYEMTKERYEQKLEELFNGELSDKERTEIFSILMSLKDGEREYLESIAWDMIEKWDETWMKSLYGTVHHWLYEKGDDKLKNKLWKKRDEAERKEENSKVERIDKILGDVFHE